MMRLRLFVAVLVFGLICNPAQAHAMPFVPAFLGGLLTALGATGLGGLVAGIGGFSAVGFSAGFSFGLFLASPLGALLLSIGSSYLSTLFGQQQQTPSEASRVNSRVAMGYRSLHFGRKLVGGNMVFGEYDAAGYWWFVIVHGDSELVSFERYWLDGIPVTVDASGNVTAKEFTIEKVNGGTPWVRVWTRTFTPTNPVPPVVAEFKTAFPAWDNDHKLVGTAYTIVRCAPFAIQERYKHYTWRGPAGIGEPSVAVEGLWDRCHDPRRPGEDVNNPATWGASENTELIWARFRTHPLGRAKPVDSIAWDKVAEEADVCDGIVSDLNGNLHKRYRCALSVYDDKQRGQAEQEILLTADATFLRDDAGRAYALCGRYVAPSLSFEAERDAISMASRDAADGEIDKDGVVIEWLDPEFGYIRQQSAAWLHPDYVETPGVMPRLHSLPVEGCVDHNQAMRLAKAVGMRSLAKSRLAPVIGVRGRAARRERFVNLDYDADYSGTYEIVTNVEKDPSGLLYSMGLVKTGPDNWTLLAGEEKQKPQLQTPIEYDAALAYPANVVLATEIIPGSEGAAVRLAVTFDPSPRQDYRYEFEYRRKTPAGPFRAFTVLMDEQYGVCDVVENGVEYEVRYRTVNNAGRANDWKTPYLSIVAVGDSVAPPALASVTAPASGLGSAVFTLATANNVHQKRVRIYRNTSGVFDVADVYGPPLYIGAGTSGSWVDGDATRTNVVVNSGFAVDADWTKGAGWTIVAGKATHAAGTASVLSQAVSLVVAQSYRIGFTVSGRTAGYVRPRFTGGTVVNWFAVTVNGLQFAELTAVAGNNALEFEASADFDGSVDTVILYPETAGCLPSDTYSYWFEPQNASGVAGPRSGPFAVPVY